MKTARRSTTRARTRSAARIAAAAPRFIDPFAPREIRRLVREFGSPLLIVDCERVRRQYRALRSALPGVDLHYALKPLPHPAVIRTVLEEGGFLDLATTGEVELVARMGVDPARCIHTHPIKRDLDIRDALARGVRVFVADNPDELRKFTPYAAAAEVLLRVSFRSPGAVSDLSRKFGCDPEHLLPLARRARDLGVTVRGLSFHVGSQAPDPGKHVEVVEVCGKLLAAARRERLGPCDTLDIGGGFPIDYGKRAPEIGWF
ncbi:MAG: type III PLP-dependent enzyme, partial [Gammaproteobacteria bacterium]